MSQPLAGPATRLEVTETSPRAVARLLKQEKVISFSFGYQFYSWFDRRARRTKKGVYEVWPGMSYRQIARVLALGQARNEGEAKIIEGWTVEDIARYLQEQKNQNPLRLKELIGSSANRTPFDSQWRESFAFLRALPSDRSLEGYLFPDTYRIWEDQLPEGLIQKQLQEFERRFGKVEIPSESAPLTSLDDVVILASIVEKEVHTDEDRRIVAGIFLARLREGMPLQSDATLGYFTGSRRSRANADDLALDSRYNSYKYKGLPPGPICNPGESAIRAVLSPVPSKFRYFLTDNSGKVWYAQTLREHAANRRRAGY